MTVFNITDGEVDGTDVGGLAVMVIADTPKVMTDGNWRLGSVIDAKASEEQAEKLGAVFGGELGGPMAALGPLVAENLGVRGYSPRFSNRCARCDCGPFSVRSPAALRFR